MNTDENGFMWGDVPPAIESVADYDWLPEQVRSALLADLPIVPRSAWRDRAGGGLHASQLEDIRRDWEARGEFVTLDRLAFPSGLASAALAWGDPDSE